MTTGGAGSTVKVALQLVVIGAQVLVTVKVIVVEPPHLSGAVPPELVRTPLQPPLKVAVAFQAVKEASIAA
jgi:hypothetical protein